MKRFSQSLFTVVAMLVFASMALAQTSQTYTVGQARDILSHPNKFVQACEAMRKSSDMQDHFVKPEHIARQLLDLVQADQNFLRKVYTMYVTKIVGWDAFIASNAIKRMKPGDDAYFKQIFEQIFERGSEGYHIKTEALRKINDLVYVKKAITEDAKVDKKATNHGADFLLVRGEELYKTDPEFVDALAENATNTFVRDAAINATSNRAILQKYANLKDIDQYHYEPGSKAAHQAFSNSFYQRTAAQRLLTLDKK